MLAQFTNSESARDGKFISIFETQHQEVVYETQIHEKLVSG